MIKIPITHTYVGKFVQLILFYCDIQNIQIDYKLWYTHDITRI